MKKRPTVTYLPYTAWAHALFISYCYSHSISLCVERNKNCIAYFDLFSLHTQLPRPMIHVSFFNTEIIVGWLDSIKRNKRWIWLAIRITRLSRHHKMFFESKKDICNWLASSYLQDGLKFVLKQYCIQTDCEIISKVVHFFLKHF